MVISTTKGMWAAGPVSSQNAMQEYMFRNTYSVMTDAIQSHLKDLFHSRRESVILYVAVLLRQVIMKMKWPAGIMLTALVQWMKLYRSQGLQFLEHCTF